MIAAWESKSAGLGRLNKGIRPEWSQPGPIHQVLFFLAHFCIQVLFRLHLQDQTGAARNIVRNLLLSRSPRTSQMGPCPSSARISNIHDTNVSLFVIRHDNRPGEQKCIPCSRGPLPKLGAPAVDRLRCCFSPVLNKAEQGNQTGVVFAGSDSSGAAFP